MQEIIYILIIILAFHFGMLYESDKAFRQMRKRQKKGEADLPKSKRI